MPVGTGSSRENSSLTDAFQILDHEGPSSASSLSQISTVETEQAGNNRLERRILRDCCLSHNVCATKACRPRAALAMSMRWRWCVNNMT